MESIYTAHYRKYTKTGGLNPFWCMQNSLRHGLDASGKHIIHDQYDDYDDDNDCDDDLFAELLEKVFTEDDEEDY